MNIDTILGLAEQHFHAGEISASEWLYSQVIGLDPKNPTALNGLGCIYFQKGNYPRAIDFIKTAVEQDAAKAEYRGNLAAAYMSSGQTELALEEAEGAVNIDHSYGEKLGYIIEHLKSTASLCMEKMQYIEALRLLSVALRIRVDADLFCRIACCYRETKNFVKAVENWRSALLLDPGHSDARRELHAVYALIVPSWHFPMMNDSARNLAFKRALDKVIKPNSIVLDIGTGSGLLSMMAAQSGAAQIHTCELVELIHHKAVEIVKRNGYEDRITLHAKRSTDLTIPKDLPERADILVTETIGTGLIEEGVLEVIEHARQNLIKPDAVVIPRGASIHMMFLDSDQIYGLHRVDSVMGFDLSPFNEFSETRDKVWPDHLCNYKHEAISEAVQVYSIEFAEEMPLLANRDLTIRATAAGTVHAVCFWFDLYLDEQITITTNPNSIKESPDFMKSESWGQRIQTFASPLVVAQGDLLEVKVRTSENAISVCPLQIIKREGAS